MLSLAEPPSDSNISIKSWADRVDDLYFNKVDADRQKFLDFQMLYMKLSKQSIKTIGHQISRMLLNCVYDEHRCSPR